MSCRQAKPNIALLGTHLELAPNQPKLPQVPPSTICAGHFRYYSSGVFDVGCGGANNHAVVLIGFNVDADPPYWVRGSVFRGQRSRHASVLA